MKKYNFKSTLFILIASLLMISLFACKPDEPTPTPVETKYNVIFDVNAGSALVTNEPSVIRVIDGQKATKPSPDPARVGYDFVGWFTDSQGTGSAYDFNTPIKANLTLYAKWELTITYHDVTINYMGAGMNTQLEIADGNLLAEPTEPTRVGYRFDGWYMDQEYSSKYNFSNTVSSDFVIYAKWIQLITLTYNLNYSGSSSDTIVTLDINQTPDEPTSPIREGYTFAGWFMDSAGNTAYDFEPLSENTTVYAKWIDNSSSPTFTVEFNYNYNGAPNNVIQTIIEGGVFTPINTTRPNYRFLGWYTDKDTYQNRVLSSTPITTDLILYAKWVNTYQLSINYNYPGAISPNSTTVDGNTPLTVPQSPSRIGYTFAGWSSSSNGLIGYDFSLGISQNTTVYAQWRKVNIFEAEYLDFSDFFGWGFSGNATGTDAILEDIGGVGGASNGRFVTYLYGKGITLNFVINSDRDVSNVTLTLRLSGEVKDFYIQSMKTPGVLEQEPVYTVKVNNQAIQYENISFTGVPSQSDNTLLPFADFTISTTVNLKQGENIISLITDNELLMGGTMGATAPMVDCIKLTTYAILTWNPILDNY